jgi:hypothetical protein
MLALALAALAAPPHADLQSVQSVYILPMSNGMHQHLTNHLVRLGMFQVVADPLRADAVLTDRLGGSFEQQLADWDAEAARKAAPPPSKDAKDPKDAKAGDTANQPLELASRQMTSAISRGKGTLFLVDRNSRRVLWSTFQKPKALMPGDLDKLAARVADQMREDSGKKR